MGTKDKKYTIEQIEYLEEIKLRYETLLETIPYITWFMDTKGRYVDINSEFLKYSGKEINQVCGYGHKSVWGLENEECELNDLKALKNKCEMKFREIVYGTYGYRSFDVHRKAVIGKDGQVRGIIAVADDMTEIKNREAQFKILIENLPFDIWQYDLEGRIVISNTNFAKRVGKDEEEIRGKSIEELIGKKLGNEIKEENKNIIRTRMPLKITKKVKGYSKERVMEVYKTPIFNIVNEVVGIVGSSIDITELVEAKERIKKEAYTDYNTGLLNRRALYKEVNGKERYKSKTVFILDVDNFKRINDTYGHHVGDDVLKQVATGLKRLSKNRKVFRLGGDEFLIIYDEELTDEMIKKRIKEISINLSKVKVENETISVSIGIASSKGSKNKMGMDIKKTDESRLIIKADIALYNAKKYEKSGYVVYTEELERQMVFISKMEKDLSYIIERDELRLVYQPQCTTEGKVVGFEALLRWNNEEYKKVSIQDIIEIMEKNKSIIVVGREIIKKACIFAKKINEGRKDKIVVSFNVSTVQLMEESFVSEIKAIIEKIGVDTDSIGIEITETVIIKDIEKSIKKLNELKEFGVKISLDDFGTGYSSFNYLVKLPLSVVKIDRSFSIELEGYEKYITLIKLIVDASQSLNLSVVAEGVETKEQLSALKKIGIEYIQGYVFSKPLEEEKAIEILK